MKLTVDTKFDTNRRAKTKHEIETAEVALIFQAYEENLSGLMRVARQLVDGELPDQAEQAIYERYLSAREMLTEIQNQAEKFQTMLMVIEHDLLERPRTTNQEDS